jgi:FAD-dependent oxidoreductase domain-containing protein 1
VSITETYDVIAIGGAVIGSSVAYYLAADPDFSGKILVVEKDPSYQRCASALSAAGIRQQYSSAINIHISLYGIEFLRQIGEALEVDGDRPDIQLHEGGYLFLATEENRPILKENHALQTKLGADILFLEPLDLVERFPWLSVEGLSAGCWGRTGEGWFDGYGLMQALRRKAQALGVIYRSAAATGVERTGDRISAVLLDDGTRISCGVVVNAAGAGGATSHGQPVSKYRPTTKSA